jgi:hypothetical protein
MSSRSPKAPGAPLSPDEVRGALRELVHQAQPDEREFGAELHRRLAAAGEPPTLGWFAWLRDGFASARPMLTGAVLGALVTATAFLLLGARGPARDTNETVDESVERRASAPPPALIEERPAPRPAMMGRGRTMGDRHVTRDRMTDDIGAERPERLHGRGR